MRDVLDSKHVDKVDLALMGSGNSYQTVQHEYNILKNIPVLVGDHFFTEENESEENKIPDEEFQGLKKVFDKVPTKKVDAQDTTEDGWTTFDENATTRKYVLPSSDRVAGGGHTHLAVFLNNPDLEDVPEELKRVPIVVHPRDCVSKEYLRDNIKQNMSLLDKDKWIAKHPPHKTTGIIVSAGPYLDYKKLKNLFANDNKYDEEEPEDVL